MKDDHIDKMRVSRAEIFSKISQKSVKRVNISWILESSFEYTKKRIRTEHRETNWMIHGPYLVLEDQEKTIYS